MIFIFHSNGSIFVKFCSFNFLRKKSLSGSCLRVIPSVLSLVYQYKTVAFKYSLLVNNFLPCSVCRSMNFSFFHFFIYWLRNFIWYRKDKFFWHESLKKDSLWNITISVGGLIIPLITITYELFLERCLDFSTMKLSHYSRFMLWMMTNGRTLMLSFSFCYYIILILKQLNLRYCVKTVSGLLVLLWI